MIPLNDLSRDVIDVKFSHPYLNGPQRNNFEIAFASYLGCDYFVGVGNGSDALEIALRCLDSKRVGVTPNAGGYGTLAVLNCGATPVFVDVDDNLCMSDDLPDVDTIIVTHLYGQPTSYAISEAKKRGIRVIEDCSHAHGAETFNKKVGTLGDLGVFSFYPTKNLGAYGNAGGISCSSKYVDRIRALKQYGWSDKYHIDYAHGRHSEMDEIQAKVLLNKLPFLDYKNARRQQIRNIYQERAPNINFIGNANSVFHLCVILVENREEFRSKLQGISTAIHYPILDYQQKALKLKGDCPNAEYFNERILTIPCFPEMTEKEIEYVAISLANA